MISFSTLQKRSRNAATTFFFSLWLLIVGHIACVVDDHVVGVHVVDVDGDVGDVDAVDAADECYADVEVFCVGRTCTADEVEEGNGFDKCRKLAWPH